MIQIEPQNTKFLQMIFNNKIRHLTPIKNQVNETNISFFGSKHIQAKAELSNNKIKASNIQSKKRLV